MPLITPVLDDRDFESLFAELRARIPVYNPQWTDHLDSDPAITLLQLFAYMGEGLQFRLNQVPEATQLAFLRLLDLPLRPARPATALVRAVSEAEVGVSVYAGDQIQAGATVFTVTQDATVWPLDCVALARVRQIAQPTAQALQGFMKALDPEVHDTLQASIDALSRQQPGLAAVAPYTLHRLEADGRSEPVDLGQTVDNCLWIALLKPEALPGFDPATALNAGAGRPVSLSLGVMPEAIRPLLDEVAACATGGAPTLWWQASLRTLGADGQPRFAAVRVSGDDTQGLSRAGTVRLELPAGAALADWGVPVAPPGLAGTGHFPPALDDERADRIWCWLRVWPGDGRRLGPLRWVGLNVLPCEQVVHAAPELLGTGDGQPDAVFQLAHRPVLHDPVQPLPLQVESQGVWQDWIQVEDLDASGPDDAHFVLDREAGTVRFGLNAPQIGERVRVGRYRWGGGAAGNVPAEALQRWGELLSSPVPPLPLRRPAGLPVKLANPFPAAGGVDAESIEAALRRIPSELRRNRRAVTADDFASLALETPTVSLARAECLPLFHAPSQQRQPGCVSVVVWPVRDPDHPEAPRPDSRELSEVCQWLDDWRLVTTELYVIPPTYQRLAVSLSVAVQPGYGLDAVRDWVSQLLRQYLSPLPPFGPDGRGWPLGRPVIARELEAVAMQAEGVAYVEALQLAREERLEPHPERHTDGGAAAAAPRWTVVARATLADWVVPELAAITVVDAATPLPAPGLGVAPPLQEAPVPVPVLPTVC